MESVNSGSLKMEEITGLSPRQAGDINRAARKIVKSNRGHDVGEFKKEAHKKVKNKEIGRRGVNRLAEEFIYTDFLSRKKPPNFLQFSRKITRAIRRMFEFKTYPDKQAKELEEFAQFFEHLRKDNRTQIIRELRDAQARMEAYTNVLQDKHDSIMNGDKLECV